MASAYADDGLAMSMVCTAPESAPTNRGMAMVCVPDDLWVNAAVPQGSLKRWVALDGALVTAGQPLAEIRIEDRVHDIVAPAAGQLFRSAQTHDPLEPCLLLGVVMLP